MDLVNCEYYYLDREMIEVQKIYKLTLTEDQARQFYNHLQYAESHDELRVIWRELKKLFDTGVR